MSDQTRKARNRYRTKKTNRSLSPRLSVHRTERNIYAQVIDDAKGITVAAYSTKAKDFKGKTHDVAAAGVVGEAVAKLALKAGVETVVFDRGQYYYHGRVKALAEGARKAGLKF